MRTLRRPRVKQLDGGHNEDHLPSTMAAIQLSKTAFTLPPTVRTLASGVPSASLLNLAARAPAGHGHGHGAVGPRSDVPAKWAGGVSATSSGLVSKTFASGTCCSDHSDTLALPNAQRREVHE